jgi:putative tryptophan/tyrosine transport system substrate-binding protein
MRRREFITLLGGAAAAWPLAARAQQPRRVAVLMANYAPTDREGQASIAAFLETLQKHGWSEGRNLRIDARWDAGDAAHMRASVAEVVRAAPDVIVAATNSVVAELARLTSTLPVVFTRVADPVGSGFVASIARPGGNITGFQASDAALGGKWIGVLKEAVPDLKRAAMIYGSDSGGNVAFLRAAQASAPAAGIELTAIDLKATGEIEPSVAAFAERLNGGLIVVPHPYTNAKRGSIITLAARHRLPAIYAYRFFAAEGGLISYGPDQIDQWRGAAGYVDRILRGEKPGDLPVQAPTKYELVVNLATARALGLAIPPALPLRADEVIE